MVAKCTGIIPIIPDLVSASGMKIGAVYKRVYGFTDLRGRPAGSSPPRLPPRLPPLRRSRRAGSWPVPAVTLGPTCYAGG